MRRGRRITPACAGKTGCYLLQRSYHWDHPRMRGEDWCGGNSECSEEGSPPHARGRLGFHCTQTTSSGITPACARKTPLPRNRCQPRKDHPRMRGEDKGGARKRKQNVGSPPHARGRQLITTILKLKTRITPACAGKTKLHPLGRTSATDHPRMRGEDTLDSSTRWTIFGSPPHARGRRWSLWKGSERSRITPACAGKTPFVEVFYLRPPDHPRMRGEDSNTVAVIDNRPGSPPHARGRR